MVHSSTLPSSRGVTLVGFAGVDGFAELDETGSVVEAGGVVEVVALAEVVALCWSEGLLPSAVLPDPHAAVVRSTATTPVPSACLLHLAGPLRSPETTTFTEVPLVRPCLVIRMMDASPSVKVGHDFGGGGELMTARARAAARPAALSVSQLIR
jgi:hypothetical protein